MRPKLMNTAPTGPADLMPRSRQFRFILAALIMISASLLTQQSSATSESPTVFVESIFTTLTEEVQALATTPSNAQIEALFKDKLSPHIDYSGLARWILREHWADSEALQRDAFLVALQKHLIKTYAAALSFDENTNLTLDKDVVSGKRLTQVSGTLTTTESNSTDIRFRLVQGPNAWQIFDVGVQGISVAKTLRADIRAIAGQGGIDAVTAALSTGNFRLISQR